MVWEIVVAVIVAGASYVQAKKAQKKAKEMTEGVEANIESNSKEIPVVYGERRVGGVRVYIDTSRDVKHKYLYMVLAMAEGEVESITDIKIDDIPITDARFKTSGGNQNLWYEVFTGTDTQTVSTLIREGVSYDNREDVWVDPYYSQHEHDVGIPDITYPWTVNHRLQGIAYLALKFKWDENAYQGIPDVTAVVKGKKVYDPRTQTTAWSDNPALCILDYLTNEKYGKGLSLSELDLDAFGQAATDCEDFTVTPFTGSTATHQLFTMDAVIDTKNKIIENLNDMLIGCRGFLPFTQGKYRLIIDQPKNSVFTFTQDHIIDGISIKGSRKEDRFNQVKVNFFNKGQEYKEDQAIYPETNSTLYQQYLAEDQGEPLVEELDIFSFDNVYSAREMARLVLERSRKNLGIAFNATSEALILDIGDVFAITHPTPAWTNKLFQVQELSFNYDGTVSVSAVEYDADLYTYDEPDEEQPYVGSRLPDTSEVDPVTNVSATAGSYIDTDGKTIGYIDVSWTPPNDEIVDRYDVKVEYNSKEEVYNTAATEHRIKPTEDGVDYIISVRAINGINVRSVWTTIEAVSSVADTTAPSDITGTSISGGLQTIDLSWTNPTDDDFDLVRIKVASTNSEPASHSFEVRADNFTHDVGAYSTTKHYWIAPVDRTGNVGNYVYAGTATTGSIAIGDIPHVAGTFYLTLGDNDAPTNAEFAGAVGRNPIEGDVAVVNKAYFFTRGASAWSEVAEFIDGSLLVSGSVNADRIEVDGASASVTIDGNTGTPILVQSDGSTVFSVSDAGNVTMNGAYITGIPVTAIPTFEADVKAVVGTVAVDAVVPSTLVEYDETDFPTNPASWLKIIDTGQTAYDSEYSFNLVFRVDDSWYYEYSGEEDKKGSQDLYYYVEGYNSVTTQWEPILDEVRYDTPVFYKLPRGGNPQEVYVIDITESLTNIPQYYTGFRVWFRGVVASEAQFGRFAFTPYMTVKSGSSGFIPQDISVTTGTASGGGSLTYDNEGGFTFNPANVPSLAGYATEDYVTTAIAGYLTSIPSEYLTQAEGDARYTQPNTVLQSVYQKSLDNSSAGYISFEFTGYNSVIGRDFYVFDVIGYKDFRDAQSFVHYTVYLRCKNSAGGALADNTITADVVAHNQSTDASLTFKLERDLSDASGLSHKLWIGIDEGYSAIHILAYPTLVGSLTRVFESDFDFTTTEPTTTVEFEPSSQGYQTDVTPSAPSITATNLVGETIEIVFSESSTSGVDRYEIWSDGGSSSYSLIGVIPQTDIAASMSFIDSTFTNSGTINYRVYAIRKGVYSLPATTSKDFTLPTLDVTNLQVIPDINVFNVSYDIPDSRFVDHVEIYLDTDTLSTGTSRANATLVYSGNRNNYTHNINAANKDDYHQFWIEIVEG